MSQKNSWRMFFNNYASQYMQESFTKNTIFEVDFIEKELQLAKNCTILDVGCGTGRHSLELARRGYQVTGLDLSEKMLHEAERVAKSEGLEIDFIHADATNFSMNKSFDESICLCEGAFGLLSMEEETFGRDAKILKNIYSALKPGGKFLLTALNGMKMIRQYSEEDIDEGKFDPINIVEINPLTDLLPNAAEDIVIKEKGFTAVELRLMLEQAGFNVENIWGGTAGAWNKERPQLDEMELMIIANKAI